MNRRSITKLPRHFCGRTGTAQERGDVRARTAAMRVCQPGPLAFQRASVSGAIRRLMATLAFGDFGRPRGFSRRAAAFLPTILGSTSAAGRARLKSAAVHSGFSSSINSGLGLRFIASYLSGVGSAQTDDVDLAGAEREYQHVQPVVNKAQRLETLFSVIPARVFHNQGAGPVKIAARANDRPRRATFRASLAGSKLISTYLMYMRIYRKASGICPARWPATSLSGLNVIPGEATIVVTRNCNEKT